MVAAAPVAEADGPDWRRENSLARASADWRRAEVVGREAASADWRRSEKGARATVDWRRSENEARGRT